MVPKFVRGLLGPSLGHVDRQHGLDRRELVAGEVSDQLLGATPGGHDLKTYPGPLLGAQGRHAGGKGHGSVLMVTFTDHRLDRPLWPQVLLWSGLDKVTASLAPSSCCLVPGAPPAPRPIGRGGGGPLLSQIC